MPSSSHRAAHRPAFAVALTLGLAISTVGVTSSADAVAPNIPQGLQVAQPNDSTNKLSWSRVGGAVRYNVQIDDDPNFASPYAIPTQTVTTVNTTLVPTVNLSSPQNYWRVQAVNAANEASGWAIGQLTTVPLGKPVLSEPTNGKLLPQPDEPPLLTWQVSPGAISYTVEVDGDDDFVDAASYPTTTNSLVVPTALDQGDWFWRVTATKSGGINSPTSDPESFVVGALPRPQLVSPVNSTSTELTDIELDWNPVTGARYYELEVATNRDFTTMVPTIPEGVTKITGTSYAPEITWANASYYWHVRAVNADGFKSDWSETFTFSRVWDHVPTPVYPPAPVAGTQTYGDPIFFQWEPVPNASEYELQVGTQEGFGEGSYNTCLVAGTTYTPGMFSVNTQDRGLPADSRPDEDCEPVAGRTNYWRVRALDRPYEMQGQVPKGIWGDFVDPPVAFDYQPEILSGKWPADGATVDVPTLRWTPVKGMEYYLIEVKKADGSMVESGRTSATTFTPSAQVGLDPLAPADGPFSWELWGVSTDNIKTRLGDARTFRVSGTLPSAPADPADQLAPISPAAEAPGTDGPPQLTWEPMAGADHYRVRVRRQGQTWFPHVLGAQPDKFEQNVAYPTMTDTGKELFAPGTYEWQVTAYDAQNKALPRPASIPADVTWPRIGQFQINAYAPTTGHRLAVDGTSTTKKTPDSAVGPCTPTQGVCEAPATPVFRWDPIPGATFYMVYLSKSPNFSTLLEPTNAIPATTNTMYAPALSNSAWAYPDSVAGTDVSEALYWHVRPCRVIAQCALAPVSVPDSYHHSFRKVSPPVTGLSPDLDPVTGAANIQSGTEVSFAWDDYYATNRASTWGQTGEKGIQSAMQYRIQVSSSPSFGTSDLVDEGIVDQPFYTSPAKLYDEGQFWWRVQAIDSKGNRLSWSNPHPARGPATFTKRSPQVVLEPMPVPEGAAGVTGTPPFRWDAQAYASGYEIELYKENDTNWSVSNRVFTKVVKTSAYAYDRPLAPNPKPYVWRVRRVDSTGQPGPWSQTGAFTVVTSAVELTSPAPDAVLAPNGPVLSWNAPADGRATKYVVEVWGPTNSLVATAETVATSYALPTAVQGGDYRWRISAKDALGAVVSTGESTFRVDARLVATAAPVIESPSGTAVGRTVSVTPPVWNQPDVTTTYQWLRDGAPIAGATGTDYALTVNDHAKAISVRATGKLASFTDGVSTSFTVNVTAGDALIATTLPSITGTPAVGSTLTGQRGTWENAPSAYNYQWLRDGVPMSGATSATYSPTAADAGTSLSFRVTASKSGYTNGIADSDPVQVRGLAATSPPVVGTPSGTGVGKTWTLTAPVWNEPDVVTSYQWLRDGVPIPGATAVTYTPVAIDLGKPVSVQAKGAKTGFSAATSASEAVVVTIGDAPAPTSTPSVTGTPKVGMTVYTQYVTWQPAATTSYQWLRNGAPITGATSASYSLTQDDVGTLVAVRLSGVREGHTTGVVDSAPVTVVASTTVTPPGGTTPGGTTPGGGTLTAVAAPLINGSSVIGQYLTATTGSWNAPPSAFKYQWRRNGVPISGATSAMYRATEADVLKQLAVAVTASRTGWTEGTSVSAAVTVPKVVSKVTGFASPVQVTPAQRAKLYITVTAPGLTSGPVGKLKIKDGRKKLTVLTLRASKMGRVTYKLPRLNAGKHKLKITYSGSAAVTKSTSKVVKLTVKR